MPKSEVEKILFSLGFKISGENITVPSWRADVGGVADIVEEILRIYGYDDVPAQPMPAASGMFSAKNNCATVLSSRGLVETVTYSFTKPELAKKFGGGKKELQLQNPISVELSEMRPSLLPNLLEAIEKNLNRGFRNIALFESGPIFCENEQTSIAGIRSGKNAEKNIYGDSRNVDVFDAKADLLAALESLKAPIGQIIAKAPEYYHPGKSGGVYLGKNCLGHFGEIHPKISKDLALPTNIVGFEIYKKNIPSVKNSYKKLETTDFQAVTRDFAFIVDKTVTSDELISIVKKSDKNISNIHIFDVYTGEKIETGKKSIALSIEVLPLDKTLKDKEIEAICANVANAVKDKLKAVIRS